MPVMPEAMSSTSSSPGAVSLGEAGLESPGGTGEGREGGRSGERGGGTGDGRRRDKRREDVKAIVDGGSEGEF